MLLVYWLTPIEKRVLVVSRQNLVEKQMVLTSENLVMVVLVVVVEVCNEGQQWQALQLVFLYFLLGFDNNGVLVGFD